MNVMLVSGRFTRHFMLVVVALLVGATGAGAQVTLPYADSRSVASRFGFPDTVARLEKSVAANDMLLLSKASASAGAANAGIKIAGNAVLFVFRNDFARRILIENVSAGFEAPLRIYVTEDNVGRTSVTWRAPTEIFSAYHTDRLRPVGEELDRILEKIVMDAVN